MLMQNSPIFLQTIAFKQTRIDVELINKDIVLAKQKQTPILSYTHIYISCLVCSHCPEQFKQTFLSGPFCMYCLIKAKTTFEENSCVHPLTHWALWSQALLILPKDRLLDYILRVSKLSKM